MESSRFDAFARALDRTLSRRRTLAALLAALPAAQVSAAKRDGKRQRGKGQRGTGKSKGRGGSGPSGQDATVTAGKCDPTACTASGGCCQGDTCVRDGGTWTPQLTFGTKGLDPNQIYSPVAIAVSADERTVFVSELFRIKIWVRTGDNWVFQTQLGSRGIGPDQFHEPQGVAVSGDGRTLWVADSGNDRIAVWRLNGGNWAPDSTFGSKGDGPSQFSVPVGIALSPDGQTVWVADEANHRISVWIRFGGSWVNQTTFGGGRGRGRNQFDQPEGVAVTPDGQTVVVADTGNFRISVWQKSGNSWVNQAIFGGERDQFDNPRQVSVSADGQTIWVADMGNHRISIWQKSGNAWVNRTTFGRKGKGIDEFYQPEGLAVSASGRTVWVADTRNDRIAIWASDSPRIWSNQSTFGRKGHDPNEFDLPTGVAISGDGQTAWVADLKNHRIAVWSRANRTSWSLQTTFGRKGDGPGEFELPSGVAASADGQTVWVADLHNSRISVWTRSGGTWSHQTTFGSRGSGASQFRNPQDVAVSANGQIVWVADQDNDRISVWTRSGGGWVNQTTFGSKGRGPGQFDQPAGVAVSADGQTVWVADYDNYRVSVWTGSGGAWAPQATFGRKGEDLNEFDGPRAVDVSQDGRTIWVADSQNHRIVVWTKLRSSGAWAPQSTFGSFGGDANELRFPSSVAIAQDEQTVWVADTSNNRISIWALTCPPA